MRKKVLSLILSLILSLSVFPAYAQEEDNESKAEKYFNITAALGIFDKETEDKNAVISRGEFAQILCNILGLNDENDKDSDWFEGFFGDADENTELITGGSSAADYYTDVDASNQYYDDINSVTSLGIMNGVGEGLFKPDEGISTLEICIALTTMMGYRKYAEFYGGYPSGYATVAEGIEITDGVSCSAQKATYYDAARLIYNSFDVELCELAHSADGFGYKTIPGKTFLSEIMEISKITGIMTDNGVTSLMGESTVGKGNVVIADTRFMNNRSELRDYLGYNVTAYYITDENEILYTDKSEKNEEVIIDAKDILEYKDNALTYYSNEKNKEIRAKLAVDASVIYNGAAELSYDSTTFDFAEGTIRLISADGNSEYETAVVESYENWYVSGVDYRNNKIYNGAQDTDINTDDAVLDLTEAIEADTLTVYDAQGKAVDYSKIQTGNVLSVAKSRENGDIVKIIVCNETYRTLKVTSLYYDEEYERQRIEFSDGSDYYVADSFYRAADAQEIRLNDEVDIYLNVFGGIAWMVKAGQNVHSVGYLIKTQYIDDMDVPSYRMKIYNESGKMDTVYMAEKVQYRNGDEIFKRDAEVIYGMISSYNGLIAYDKDSEGKIKYIETPCSERNENGAFQVMYDSKGEEVQCKSYGGWQSFDNRKIVIDASTKIFKIPASQENRDNEKMYDITASFVTDNGYALKAYGFKGSSGLAEYLVYENDIATADSFRLNGSDSEWRFVFVTGIKKGMNADEEVGTVITGGQVGYSDNFSNVELFCVAEDGSDPTLNAEDILKSGKTYTIKKGDIIRYLTDSSGERVIDVELFFRLDGENPVYPEGPRGFLAGSIGKYDPDIDCGNRYNPWVFEHNQINNGYNGLREDPINMGGNRKVAYGYVYDYQDGLIQYTTRNLVYESFDANNPFYLTQYWIPYNKVVTITKEGKDYSIKEGMADMRTYRSSGSDCSRIITVLMQGLSQVTFIINSDE